MEKETINQVRNLIGLTNYQSIGPNKDREIFYGDLSKTKGVSLNNAAITNDTHPTIGTYGLGPCIAIAGLDKKTKTAFLSHNVPIKKLEDLNDHIFDKLEKKGIDLNNLEFYLIGGNPEYKQHAEEIKIYLNKKINNPKIIYTDLIETNDPKKLGKSFILDSRNGNFYCHDGISSFD